MHNKSCFIAPFGRQRVNGTQTLQKSPRQHIYPTFWSFWSKQSWKMSLLARSKVLGLFVNPMTVDAKYSRHNTGTLRQPIEMHLF